jgi:hypothetical protein
MDSKAMRRMMGQYNPKELAINELERDGFFGIDAGQRPGKLFPITAGAHEAFWQESSMPEGYCVKCKASKEIAEMVEVTMKNGRKAIKGKCPTCGTVMFKILSGKSAAPKPAPGN